MAVAPSPSGFGNAVRTRECTPRVFLDGAPVLQGSFDFDGLVRPADVLGIEVYTNPATAPPQYVGGLRGSCAILIWTKH